MKIRVLIAALASAVLTVFHVHATGQDPRVEVVFVDPDQFPDARYTLLDELKAYLVERGAHIVPEGQRLTVDITDLRLAGTYEWWRTPGSPDFRVIQDATPPRIALRFKLVDAGGTVLAGGARILVDQNFVGQSLVHLVGPLRYEKALIDRWLASEFGSRSTRSPR